MKMLVFTLHFWLKRLRGTNNNKNDNKYNITDYKFSRYKIFFQYNKYEIKQQMQHKDQIGERSTVTLPLRCYKHLKMLILKKIKIHPKSQLRR